MKQRAHFPCPTSGQAIVAIFDEKTGRLKVDTLNHEEPRETTKAWLMGFAPPAGCYDVYPTLDHAAQQLWRAGVATLDLEFEGI